MDSFLPSTTAFTFNILVREALNLPLLTVPPPPFEISEEAQNDSRVYLQEMSAGALRIMNDASEE
jgi:hypothetical protein